jgi:hypothetical protein
MIVVIGLLALIAATVVTRASVVTNSDSIQPLSDNFVISALRHGPPLCACAATGSPVNPPGVDKYHRSFGIPHRSKPTRCAGSRFGRAQRHWTGGAYLTVAQRRETGRRDRKRPRVTLRRPGLQGENPGKKERS